MTIKRQKKGFTTRPLLPSDSSSLRTTIHAVVMDPKVVFVASLMKADAPALVASFQCDVSMQSENDGTQSMRASLRELKVLACPFIPDQQKDSVTTVSARARHARSSPSSSL